MVPESVIGGVPPEAIERILEGDPSNFGEDVADMHILIVDADHAKTIYKKLNISMSDNWADNPEERLLVARKIWLYATLRTDVFDVPVADAKMVVSRAFDDIPF